MPGREVRLQQVAHLRMVGRFSFEVAHRVPKQRRFGDARGVLGIGMRPAETIVSEQSSHLRVIDDEPGFVAGGSADPMNDASLQCAQFGRDIQWRCLAKRQLRGGRHRYTSGSIPTERPKAFTSKIIADQPLTDEANEWTTRGA
jgi:hypothetical protein